MYVGFIGKKNQSTFVHLTMLQRNGGKLKQNHNFIVLDWHNVYCIYNTVYAYLFYKYSRSWAHYTERKWILFVWLGPFFIITHKEKIFRCIAILYFFRLVLLVTRLFVLMVWGYFSSLLCLLLLTIFPRRFLVIWTINS